MDSTRPLRIGLVGAGGIVKQRHLPGLRALPGISFRAVANSSLASAEAFCRDFAPEAEPLARWEEVVDHDEVDIVWIGAHPNLHADATCFALERGKHVFTQARMAASLAEAERMWEKAQSFPELVTGICPAPHGLGAGNRLRELLAGGAIGKPHQVVLHSFNPLWLDPAQAGHWRRRSEASGIQILTLGIYIEVLQRWLGHIVEVEARGGFAGSAPDAVDIPDFLHVLARFRDGTEAALLFSGVAAHAPGDQLWIHGGEGTLHYDFGDESLRLGRRGSTLSTVEVPPALQGGWTVERDFIAAVRDPAAPRPRPDFTEGLCYMRVVDAVWRALESGQAQRCA